MADPFDTTMIRITFTPDGGGMRIRREFELFGVHQVGRMIRETLSCDPSGGAGVVTVEPWIYRIDMPVDRRKVMPRIATALGVPLGADGVVRIYLGSVYDD